MTLGNQKKIERVFFQNLVIRQIRQDYLENLTGFAWLILQPLIFLAVYAFVFSTIFKARMPQDVDIGFVPYLAIAFWPWTAFSEAVLRASNSITSSGSLIGKIAFAAEQIPLATVTATFIMHMIGYLTVLIVLQLMGTSIHWFHLSLVVPLMLLMWLFACGIALFTSATQVFVRDLAQIMPPLMTLWFFTTPILYAASYLPESVQAIARWNPMAWFIARLRELLLFGEINFGGIALAMALIIVVFAWLSLRFFRRFSGHFEDFL
ncbi:MAG: ABC transporter permease [Gammaproteobacteria bacterium]|nr:ABC transporter permease [Gammaproteobacteria bacterium]MBT8076764.1 ABC transporter permease [Gammaproteobacteria bacterium]NNK97916.1 ABC transporter permease [Xanthomonadales bacterium]